MTKDKDQAFEISSESVAYLEEVKKGKARRFAMICKGSSVVSLVVYKKGSVEKYKKEAKQSGKGQFYFGVVDGKGIDIRFALARTDGFEDAPVKTTVLKSFLDDAGDFKCKPYFEVVDSLPDIPDADEAPAGETSASDASTTSQTSASDNPTAAPAAAASGPTTEPAGVAAQAGTADDIAAAQSRLINALKELKPQLESACARHSDRAAELTTQFKQIAALIKAQQTAEADQALGPYQQLLQQLNQASDSTSNPAADFNARLKSLLPAIKEAIGAGRGDTLKSLAQQAGQLAAKQEFAQANQLLDQAQALLSAPATPSSTNVVEIWRDAKDQVDSQFNKLISAMRKSPHPYLQKVSELGLAGLVQDPSRIFVKMQASLFDFVSLPATQRGQASQKVLESARNYRQFVQSSKLLEVCDSQNLCGPLTIRQTLLQALSEIEKQVVN